VEEQICCIFFIPL